METTTEIEVLNQKLDLILQTLEDVFLTHQEYLDVKNLKKQIKAGEHKDMSLLDDI